MRLIILSFLFLVRIDASGQEGDFNGIFMNMQPSQTPVLLAPEILASSLQEYNGVFSNNGKEFYFTTNTPGKGIICYTTMKADGSWSLPKIASFSGKYSEYDPLLHPNGSKLYFSSERPTLDTLQKARTNIWVVDRIGDDWSSPKIIPLSGNGDYYSSLTKHGDIYFNVWNNGNIFKAVETNGEYIIEELPAEINSPKGEGDPFISPDEDYLIFRGYNNTIGNGDLYISFNINNKWTMPENLGEPVNSSTHEMCPYVTNDGKFFIFSSSRQKESYKTAPNIAIDKIRNRHSTHDNGELNIYYMSADFIAELRTKFE